jgi:site-specific recombinase XerD
MLIRDAISNYLAECSRLQPKTLSWYQQKLSVFADFCDKEQIDLDGINNRIVVRFQEYLANTRSPRKATMMSSYTIKGYVQVVKGFVNWCSQDDEYEDYIAAKTPKRIKLPKVDQVVIEIFTEDQINALFKACKKEYNEYLRDRDQTILAILLGTGIRSNELCSLTIDHCFLSPDDAYLKIYGKGRKWREVGLTNDVRRKLQQFIRKHRTGAKADERVMLTRSSKPMTPDGMVQLFNRLEAWAGGFEGIRCSPHTCRHTFAVNYMANGGGIYDLEVLMGHGTVKVTEIYLKAMKHKDIRNLDKQSRKRYSM